jgi:hypothetical protein
MASEHPEQDGRDPQDDDRDQQLETLRQYMVRPDTRWEPPAQLGVLGEQLGLDLGAPPRRRPTLPWLLVTGLLVVAALAGGLVVGAVVWSDDRPAPAAAPATSRPAPGRDAGAAAPAIVATPACKTAVDRANAMLASAVKLREALAEQDRVLNDPATRGLPVDQVLARLAASQQVGSSESARFDQALDAYRQVVDRCDLRAG